MKTKNIPKPIEKNPNLIIYHQLQEIFHNITSLDFSEVFNKHVDIRSKNSKVITHFHQGCKAHLGKSTPNDFFAHFVMTLNHFMPESVTLVKDAHTNEFSLIFRKPLQLILAGIQEFLKKNNKNNTETDKPDIHAYFQSLSITEENSANKNEQLAENKLETTDVALHQKEKPLLDIEVKTETKAKQPDFVVAIINTLKDIYLHQKSNKDNLCKRGKIFDAILFHIAELKKINPANQKENTIDYVKAQQNYMYHTFRLWRLLAIQDKVQDFNYRARCAVKHHDLRLSFKAFYHRYHDLLAAIERFAREIQQQSFLTLMVTLSDYEKEKQLFADFEKTIATDKQKKPNAIQAKKIKTKQKKLLTQILSDEQFDAEHDKAVVVMLQAHIGMYEKKRKKSVPIAKQICINFSHDCDVPAQAFLDQLYALHSAAMQKDQNNSVLNQTAQTITETIKPSIGKR